MRSVTLPRAPRAGESGLSRRDKPGGGGPKHDERVEALNRHAMSRSVRPAAFVAGRATLTRFASEAREPTSPTRRSATRGRGERVLGRFLPTASPWGGVAERSEATEGTSSYGLRARSLREASAPFIGRPLRLANCVREAASPTRRVATRGRGERDRWARRATSSSDVPSASRTAFARRPLPLVAWRLAGEASAIAARGERPVHRTSPPPRELRSLGTSPTSLRSVREEFRSTTPRPRDARSRRSSGVRRADRGDGKARRCSASSAHDDRRPVARPGGGVHSWSRPPRGRATRKGGRRDQ